MSGRGRLAVLCAAALLTCAPVGPRAEQLVVSLSSDRIAINSNFTGAELALFGAIERDAMTVPRRGDYDVVVTVRGPRGSVTVREKKQLGPLWVNLEQRKFIAVPAFISVLSNRALQDIASDDLRAKLRLGITPLIPEQAASDVAVNPQFRDSLIRLRREERLFREDARGVQLLSANLFRAAVRIPGTAPLGAYEVDVAVFSDGTAVTNASVAFNVIKSGVEQRITDYSRQSALAYGLGASGLALALGWLATVIFRRD